MIEIFLYYPEGLFQPYGCTIRELFVCDFAYEPGTARYFGESEIPFAGDMSLGTVGLQAPDYNCTAIVEVEWNLGGVTNDALITIEGGPDVASGDVNCDGIDAVDALLVLQVEAGLLTSVPYPEHVDVDGDGIHTSMDATVILQYVAGLLGSLPP